MTANGIPFCREQQYLPASSGKRDKATCLKKINLQHLVMHLNFFMVIGVTLGKLIDFDPKLLDFPSDLPITQTHQGNYLTSKARWLNVVSAHISDQPSASLRTPRQASCSQLWPTQELYWLFHAGPSYTPRPEVGGCNTYKHAWTLRQSPAVTAPEGLRSQRTRGWTGRWSTGSSGLCCLGCSSCSSRSHLWNTAQTAGRCSPLCFASWWSDIGSLWVQQNGRSDCLSELSWAPALVAEL